MPASSQNLLHCIFFVVVSLMNRPGFRVGDMEAPGEDGVWRHRLADAFESLRVRCHDAAHAAKLHWVQTHKQGAARKGDNPIFHFFAVFFTHLISHNRQLGCYFRH